MTRTTPAHRLAARACSLWIAGMLLHVAAAPAWARPPRAARVADRVAERVYARQSIAEARAARAEARALEIARIVHEFAPVGGWATSGRDGRRLEWLAEVCEDLPPPCPPVAASCRLPTFPIASEVTAGLSL